MNKSILQEVFQNSWHGSDDGDGNYYTSRSHTVTQPHRQKLLSRIFRSRSLRKNLASLPQHKEKKLQTIPQNACFPESKSLQCFADLCYQCYDQTVQSDDQTRQYETTLIGLRPIYLNGSINIVLFYFLNKSIVFTTD